jgi:hypothetical protein
MRVRALSLFVVIGMLVPSAALASEAETTRPDTQTITETAAETARPPGRMSVGTAAAEHGQLVENSTADAATSEASSPAGRWFGCQPPFGGLCVQDRDTAKTVSDLLPDWSGDAQDWLPLVQAFFAPGDVARAMVVIGCESGGDPNAKNRYSSASGLFQHLGRFWGERSDLAGYSGSDIFDPLANVAVASWLVYDGGGWSHWAASSHCWG